MTDEELGRLARQRNEARAERDAAYRALDQMRDWLEAIDSGSMFGSTFSHVKKLDEFDPRKQTTREARP